MTHILNGMFSVIAFDFELLQDTTPLWSTRGKLRTRLVPLLQEIYGEGVRMRC